MRTGNEHLRPLVGFAHLKHIDLDAVIVVVFLARNRFVHGNQAVRFAQFNINAALFHALHNGGKDFVFLFNILIENHAAFRFADALHHNLLGRLCGNAAKVAGIRLFFENVAHLIKRVDRTRFFQRNLSMDVFHLLDNRFGCKNLHLARVAIHHGAHIARSAVVALICRDQRGFKRVNQNILADAAFLFNCVECLHEFGVH